METVTSKDGTRIAYDRTGRGEPVILVAGAYRSDLALQRGNTTQARVARVGTVDERGRVHLVPVTFALAGEAWYSPTDAGERQAKRLRNLARDPPGQHPHRCLRRRLGQGLVGQAVRQRLCRQRRPRA